MSKFGKQELLESSQESWNQSSTKIRNHVNENLWCWTPQSSIIIIKRTTYLCKYAHKYLVFSKTQSAFLVTTAFLLVNYCPTKWQLPECM